MATQADVRRIALALSGTVESKTDFAFSLIVKEKAKGYAWVWKERVDPKKSRVPNPKVLAVRTASLDDYGPRLDSALGRALAASWKAKLAMDRFPRLVFGIARIPTVWGFTAAFLRGDLAHPDEAHGLVRLPLRLVDRLGRSSVPA